MATPRITIPELPPVAALDDTDEIVVQNGEITKRMPVGSITVPGRTALADHLGDANDAHQASAVGATANPAPMDGTNVQLQLSQAAAELVTLRGETPAALAAHLTDAVDAHDASAISVTPLQYRSGTDVQSVLAEISTLVGDGEMMEVGPAPPLDTEWLWADTTVTGDSTGMLPSPVFDVRTYGARGDGVVDDVAAFQACYDAAVAAHGVMYIPTPPVAWRLTGQVDCNVAGPVVIEGDGPTSLIHMDVFPFPVFDILDAPDHTVQNLAAKGTAGRDNAGFLGDYRDTSQKGYSAVVWTNSPNTVVRHISGETFTSIVKVTSWDMIADDYGTEPTPGIVVEHIKCADCEFGLLMRSTVGMVWDDINGTYSLSPNSNTPTHLIYGSDLGPQTTAMRGGSATAIGGRDGAAFQFKNVGPGSTVETLTAKDCTGALVLATCDGLLIDRVVAVHDSIVSPQGAIAFIEGTKDCEIDYIRFDGVGDGPAIRCHDDTQDICINRWKVVTAHTVAPASTNVGDIELQGFNQTVGPGRWIANGPQLRSGVVVNHGAGHWIGKVSATGIGAGQAIRVRDVATGLVTLESVDAVNTVVGAPVTYRRERPATATIGLDRILVADEFDFPNGTAGALLTPTAAPTNWVLNSGTWRIIDGRAYEQAGAANASCHLESGSSNVEVSVGLVMPSTGSAGLVISSDGPNQLLVTMTTAAITMAKRVAGTITSINSTPGTYTIARRYLLMVRKFGSTINVLVDGLSVVTYTLDAGETTAIAALTKHGLRSNSTTAARFDNFVVRSLT